MAFTATIDSIVLENDSFKLGVTYNDSATGFVCKKCYFFDAATATQATVVAQLTADGNVLKSNLAKNNTLQSKVGTVLTI